MLLCFHNGSILSKGELFGREKFQVVMRYWCIGFCGDPRLDRRCTAFVLTFRLHIPEGLVARRTADLEGLGGSKWHFL